MLVTNPERTKKVIEILLDWYSTRSGLMKGAELPESKPPTGVIRGSYEHIMFLTLAVSIDYQRSAKDLWDSARTTWEDKSTRWAFFPEEIKKRSIEELVECLAQYKLSKKREKAAERGRAKVPEIVRQSMDTQFAKLSYDPYDIKPLLHPVEFVVFNGMNNGDINNVILLSRISSNPGLQNLQKAVAKAIDDKLYDWKVARVSLDGGVEFE